MIATTKDFDNNTSIKSFISYRGIKFIGSDIIKNNLRIFLVQDI